ncbi:COG3747 Phage terminase, small subunit [uncultured Caudovirales phage]|uniref:COG3747 Phage terminase, small subunit n=1 Tax=uncultured Caudovirales phage TaxID=2100421 RepID=A0A6J5RRL6_9CAUD|nr:COG3747 Phage terminase, small subunit [uncultured Caudovirales phage]
MAGRNRKPDSVKKVTGTLQNCRVNTAQPVLPAVSSILAPGYLDATAQDAWNQVAEIASDMGVLTASDAIALEAFAGALSDLRNARSSLNRALVVNLVDEETGEVIGEKILAKAGDRYYWVAGDKRSAMLKPRPELADIADAERRVATWSSKFGMNPADRSRVSVGPAIEIDAFAEF